MGDQLGQRVATDAVVLRTPQMKRELFDPVEGDQRRHRGEAALTWRQAGAQPDVAEQRLVGEFGQLGSQVAQGLLAIVRIEGHRWLRVV